MKKGTKITIIILSLVIVALIAFIIIDKVVINNKESGDNKATNNVVEENKADENNTIENNDVNNAITNATVNTVNTTNSTNTVENTTNKSNTTAQSESVKDFNENDLTLSGVKLGMSTEEAMIKVGSKFDSNSYEDPNGDKITQLVYSNLGLVLEVKTSGEDGIVNSMTIADNSTMEVTRGLKVSSTADQVLKAFNSESILAKTSNRIVVGYKGDDPDYNISKKGKIYFTIVSNKVTGITISYGGGE